MASLPGYVLHHVIEYEVWKMKSRSYISSPSSSTFIVEGQGYSPVFVQIVQNKYTNPNGYLIEIINLMQSRAELFLVLFPSTPHSQTLKRYYAVNLCPKSKSSEPLKISWKWTIADGMPRPFFLAVSYLILLAQKVSTGQPTPE